MTEREIPEGYVQACKALALCLRNAIANGMDPKFAMPPPEYLVVAPLDAIASNICKNDDARELVPVLMQAAKGDATLFQLRAALDIEKIAYEVVSLDALGIKIAGMSRGIGQA